VKRQRKAANPLNCQCKLHQWKEQVIFWNDFSAVRYWGFPTAACVFW